MSVQNTREVYASLKKIISGSKFSLAKQGECTSSFQTQAKAEAQNRSCGDTLFLHWQVNSENQCRVAYSGDHCALCSASAEVLCEWVNSSIEQFDQSLSVVESVAKSFHTIRLSPDSTPDERINTQIPRLEVIQQCVAHMPSRAECAALPWKAASQLIGERPHD